MSVVEEDSGHGFVEDKSEDLEYGAIVQPRFAFGCSGQGQGAMAFLEADKLLFPAGAHMSHFCAHTEEMRLTPVGEHVRSVMCVVLSPNRKYWASIECLEASSAHGVGVYAVASGKRVKTVPLDAAVTGGATEVVCISFSESSKLLAVQCGEPDHALLVYRWYTGKLLVSQHHEWPVLTSAFSPVDDTLLMAAGATAVSQYRLDLEGGSARTTPVASVDETRGAFTGAAWIMGNLLALTTIKGRIQVTQDNCTKAVLCPDQEDSLMCVTPRGRGFLAAGRKGMVYFYEPPDVLAKRGGSKEIFSLVRSLDARIPGRAIVQMAVSSGDDAVAVQTSAGEILLVSMRQVIDQEEKGIDQLLGRGWTLTGDAEHEPFRLVVGGLGGQRVVGCDATVQQPLLAVVTANRVVRIINYQTKRPVLVRQLLDDVLSAALHPSGTMLLVGLHDKLQLFSIALDDLQEVASFHVKQCHRVRYSPGGAMFAAVGRNNTIVVHHAYKFTQLALLKGHVSAVTDLTFSSDERLLCSTGAGGAVYFWDLATGNRLPDAEFVDKMNIYAAAAFATGGGTSGAYRSIASVVRTNDGRLQHISGGRAEFTLAAPRGGDSACLALLGGDRVVLTTDMQGNLLSYPWPASFPAPVGLESLLIPRTYRLHASGGSITHMVAFPERGLLLTAGTDGVVLLSSLTLVLGGTLMGGLDEAQAEGGPGQGGMLPTMLVPVERLSGATARLVDMAGQLASTKSNAEYTAFRAAQGLREALSRVEAELATAREELAISAAHIAGAQQQAAGKELDIVKTLEGAHLAAAEELEALYDKRLEHEAEKQRQAQQRHDDQLFKAEEQFKRFKVQKEAETAAQTKRSLQALAREREAAEELRQQRDKDASYWAEYADQAEVDFDTASGRLNARLADTAEAAELRKGHMQAELNLLKRAGLRLKGEKALDAKRVDKLLKDNMKAQETIDDLQATVEKVTRELHERDEVLADNYDTLQILRRKMADLEKHKYVLAYKAEAYQAELEPRNAEVRALKGDLQAQEGELLRQMTAANTQARAVAEKDATSRALKSELASAKLRIAHQETLLRMFSYDVSQVYNAINESGTGGSTPIMKSTQQKGLQELYDKYVVNGAVALKSNQQVEAELTRHLQMSELRVQLATQRIDTDQKQAQAGRQSMVHQNTQLLRELQVSAQDNRALARTLDSTQVALGELGSRYRILDQRVRGTFGTDEDLPHDSSRPRGVEAGAGLGAGVLSQTGGPIRPGSARPGSGSGPGPGGGRGGRGRPSTARPASAGLPPHPHHMAAGGRANFAPLELGSGPRNAGGPSSGSLLTGTATARTLQQVVERQQVGLAPGSTAGQGSGAEGDTGGTRTSTGSPGSGHPHSVANGAQGSWVAGGGGANMGMRMSLQAQQLSSLGLPIELLLQDVPASTGAEGVPSNVKGMQPGHAAPGGSIGGGGAPAASYGALLNRSGPLPAFASPGRRRPTTAGGVGLRAYMNTSLQQWRET